MIDFACGTGGFLVCALEHLRKQVKNIEDEKALQESILGIEKKPLPHMLCTTNMILHNIDNPQIKHDNSLSYPVKDIKPKDKVDIILTNPPFGGIEEDGVQDNFPKNLKTKETADLFLVLLMYKLNQTGRAAIVLPDGFLFGEGTKTAIKEKLLDEFNLHTIVRLPNGVFAPYTGINTNLLFLERGKTKDVWFYEHQLPASYKNYTKTKPIQEQYKTVEKIKTVEHDIIKLNQKITQQYDDCNKLRQSILQQAVKGKLCEQNPDDEPASILLEKIKTEKEKFVTEGKIKKQKICHLFQTKKKSLKFLMAGNGVGLVK